ncbi:MAG: zf-HC2 domain-containing protein [Acidimicrobiales bacterium]
MTHPTDLELAQFVDGLLNEQDADVVRRHLDGCAACRALVADIGPANWSRRVPTAAAPFTSGGLKEGFANVPGDPRPGELWHLEWEEDAALALVLAADLSSVHIVPVVVDTDAADESVVWISADDGPLGVELAAWVGLVISVPLGVLHASFGSVNAAAFVQVRQAAATERSLASSGDMIIGGYAHIAAVIGRLSAAKWAEAPAQDPIDLRKRAQDLGISVATLAQGLAVAPGEVTELFRGQRAPSPTEVEALANILQIDVLKLRRTPTIPEDMERSIERPAWRPRLRDRARKLGISEAAARRQLAVDLLPVAARTTGPTRGRPDWNQLIAELLADDG